MDLILKFPEMYLETKREKKSFEICVIKENLI